MSKLVYSLTPMEASKLHDKLVTVIRELDGLGMCAVELDNTILTVIPTHGCQDYIAGFIDGWLERGQENNSD